MIHQFKWDRTNGNGKYFSETFPRLSISFEFATVLNTFRLPKVAENQRV